MGVFTKLATPFIGTVLNGDLGGSAEALLITMEKIKFIGNGSVDLQKQGRLVAPGCCAVYKKGEFLLQEMMTNEIPQNSSELTWTWIKNNLPKFWAQIERKQSTPKGYGSTKSGLRELFQTQTWTKVDNPEDLHVFKYERICFVCRKVKSDAVLNVGTNVAAFEVVTSKPEIAPGTVNLQILPEEKPAKSKKSTWLVQSVTLARGRTIADGRIYFDDASDASAIFKEIERRFRAEGGAVADTSKMSEYTTVTYRFPPGVQPPCSARVEYASKESSSDSGKPVGFLEFSILDLIPEASEELQQKMKAVFVIQHCEDNLWNLVFNHGKPDTSYFDLEQHYLETHQSKFRGTGTRVGSRAVVAGGNPKPGHVM
jgi:hypothetical protein